MKDDRKKIKEPYNPRETPAPPQSVHPTDKGGNSAGGGSNQPAKEENSKTNVQHGNGHLLTDDADIDDETTI